MFKIVKIEYAELPTQVHPSAIRYSTCSWYDVPVEYIEQIRSKLVLEGPSASNFPEFTGPNNKIYSVEGFVNGGSFGNNFNFNQLDYEQAADKVAYLLSKLKFKVMKDKLPDIQATLTKWRAEFALESLIGKPITLNELPISKSDDFTKPHYQYKDSKLVLMLKEYGYSLGAWAYTSNDLGDFATLYLTTVDDNPITKWCTHCQTVA